MVASGRERSANNPNVQAAVYVTEGGYSGVQSFPLGSSGSVKPTTSVTGDTTGLDGTAAVVIDPISGTLYVASAGNEEIAEFPYGATGNIAPSAVISGDATHLGYPMALALDSSGRLYVANHSANTITVYASGAAVNAPAAGDHQRAGTGLAGPTGLTLDRAGNLLVANQLGRVAHRISDQRGRHSRRAAHHLGPIAARRVDVDTQGNIYVANGLGGVSECGPEAKDAATAIATISGQATGISAPSGIAVAPPLVVHTRKLPAARVGRLYSVQLRARLGTTPYRWTVMTLDGMRLTGHDASLHMPPRTS